MGKSGRKHNNKGRSEGDHRYVQLYYWVLESKAALALSGSAFKVLVYLVKRFNGENNGRIGFGSRSGCFLRDPLTRKLVECSFGFKYRTVAYALNELEAAGFIACTKDSSFGQKKKVKEWRVTWLPHNGQPATKDFVRVNGLFLKPRKQKPAHLRALTETFQRTEAPCRESSKDCYPAASASGGTAPLRDRAPECAHLDPMDSGSDVVSAARALMEQRARATSLALFKSASVRRGKAIPPSTAKTLERK